MPCPTCGTLADGTWPEILGCTYNGVVCSRKCALTQHLHAEEPGVEKPCCGGCGYTNFKCSHCKTRRATVGFYCGICLDDETRNMSFEDLDAAGSFFDRLKETS